MGFPDSVADLFRETAFDDSGTGTAISDEVVTVPASSPYRVDLKYIAKNDASIQVWTQSGQTGTQLTETSSTSPGANEFYVDYNYARVVLNSSRASETLYVTYTSLGSVRRVVDTNEARTEIEAIEEFLINTQASNIIQDDTEVWVDATLGSDSNPGTEAEPYETINKALELARDKVYVNATLTVNVMPGTYNSNEVMVPFFSRTAGLFVNLNWLMVVKDCQCLGSSEVIIQRAPLESDTVLVTSATALAGYATNANKVTFKDIRMQCVGGVAFANSRGSKLERCEVWTTVLDSFGVGARESDVIIEDGAVLGANNGVFIEDSASVSCLGPLIWGHPVAGIYATFGGLGFADSDAGSGIPFTVTSVSNPGGSTYRYNVSETVEEPVLTFGTHLEAENVGGGNDGNYAITGVGSSYFEVSNVGGSVVGSAPPGASVFMANGNYGALADFNGVGYIFGSALKGSTARGEQNGGQQVNP